METLVRTPQQIFNLSQHLNVPLYQRRYVWDETEQWEPRWADVRRTAELRLAGTSSAAPLLAPGTELLPGTRASHEPSSPSRDF